MDRWVGKVAVVTGASSGIGAATVKELAKAGLVTVGLARRVERVEALKAELPPEAAARVHANRCDVSKESDILSVFRWVEQKFGGIDVLVNNAGILRTTSSLLDPGNSTDIKDVLETNVTGLVFCSREAYQSMKKRSVDGHIIHINSIAGHHVQQRPNLNIYPASKFAVTAITETMRYEMREAGTNIKVTSISPGGVRTEILERIELPDDVKLLQPEDVAEAVLYALSTPPRVQIHEIIIKPVGELL